MTRLKAVLQTSPCLGVFCVLFAFLAAILSWLIAVSLWSRADFGERGSLALTQKGRMIIRPYGRVVLTSDFKHQTSHFRRHPLANRSLSGTMRPLVADGSVWVEKWDESNHFGIAADGCAGFLRPLVHAPHPGGLRRRRRALRRQALPGLAGAAGRGLFCLLVEGLHAVRPALGYARPPRLPVLLQLHPHGPAGGF